MARRNGVAPARLVHALAKYITDMRAISLARCSPGKYALLHISTKNRDISHTRVGSAHAPVPLRSHPSFLSRDMVLLFLEGCDLIVSMQRGNKLFIV